MEGWGEAANTFETSFGDDENIQKLIDLRGYYRVTGRHPGYKVFNPDDDILHKKD